MLEMEMFVISRESLELLSLLLTAALAILGLLYKRRIEEMKIMRSQLSEKKHKAYADIVAAFYSVLKDSKNHQPSNMRTIQSKVMDAKRDIFMYGSDDVFLAFNNWLVHSAESNQFHYFLKFILSIRNDINGKTILKEDDILLNLTQNKEELEAIKKMINS